MQLPIYNGLVYRGVALQSWSWKKGQIHCFKAFSSSSLEKDKGKLFTKGVGKGTIFIIHSLTGRDISNYSYFKTELEVLFMPYTYFEVGEVTEQGGFMEV